ncbi:Pentatricopeptide repeat-containing protein [Ananas comosus]|uniref:Pentatricopeptide repeat-containing protein n=1 Tax=Ananas comosus TaxID=4615 RepID=A0A199VY90_ANACO|nr:Pentatricopeptide repeat-containing protein [Ananas comosus]
MALSSLLNPNLFLVPSSLSPLHSPSTRSLAITCGPRDNRGPLQRGRTLSTEAILAVQALKRAALSGDGAVPSPAAAAAALGRLLKPDLLAALAELQRQGRWRLALVVFAAARRETWYTNPDFALYAEMASAMARGGAAAEEIDALVAELLEEKEGSGGFSPSDDVWKLTRLVRVLIAAGRGEAVRDLYKRMKRGGCVGDEYLFRVLIRGLRRLGEGEAAGEVERDFDEWYEGGIITETLPV